VLLGQTKIVRWARFTRAAQPANGRGASVGGVRALDVVFSTTPRVEETWPLRGRYKSGARGWRKPYPTLSGGERRPVDDRIETDVPCRHPTEHFAKGASDLPPLL